MRCQTCGKDWPSRHYFVTDSLCNECFGQIPEAEQKAVRADVESLNREGAARRVVGGWDLECPICGHREFWKRKTLMNTPGLTFFGVEWANRQADNYVCDACGHVLWFVREDS